MRFSLLSIIPLAGLFGQAIATPVVAPPSEAALEKRQYEGIESRLQMLYSDIQVHTSNINSSMAIFPKRPTLLERGMSLHLMGREISALVDTINDATSDFKSMKKRSLDDGSPVVKRQSGSEAIVAVLGLIFSEIAGSIRNIINGLGLGAFLAFLNPLGTALANLLLALRDLVDQLLILVRELLDGILEGLAGALGGFNFGF